MTEKPRSLFKKPKHLFTIIILFYFLFSCSENSLKEVNVNLFLANKISEKSDTGLPKLVLDLLKPIECPIESNIIVKLKVHRYDFNPTKIEDVKLELDGIHALRGNLNMLSFKHNKDAYLKYASSSSNLPIFYEEAKEKIKDLRQKEEAITSNAIPDILCCNQSGKETQNVTLDMKNLVVTLTDSLCLTDNPEFDILLSVTNKVDMDNIQDVFNEIGNSKISHEARLSMIEEHINLFSEDSYVRVIGSNGTLFAPEPIRTYLGKIALFRSLKQIEIVEKRKNDSDKYWEIHLREIHENF